MSRQLAELETVLRQLIDEHRKLLAHVTAQQAAMRKLDLQAMDDASHLQEATRLRIAMLETKRRGLVTEVSRGLRIGEPATLAKLAEAHPQSKQRLLGLRDELKGLVAQVASRAHVAGRLAGAGVADRHADVGLADLETLVGPFGDGLDRLLGLAASLGIAAQRDPAARRLDQHSEGVLDQGCVARVRAGDRAGGDIGQRDEFGRAAHKAISSAGSTC